MKRYIQCKEQSNGVFWVVDDKLLSFPYYDYQHVGVSNSGATLNHRRLWPEIAPHGHRNKSFDYYPRGRVEFKSDGTPVIYMNPNIDDKYIPEIKIEFGLRQDPEIHYDYSDHYRCHLDTGYRSNRR